MKKNLKDSKKEVSFLSERPVKRDHYWGSKDIEYWDGLMGICKSLKINVE